MSLDLMDSLHLIALHCQRDKWLDMGERRRGGRNLPSLRKPIQSSREELSKTVIKKGGSRWEICNPVFTLQRLPFVKAGC